MKNNNNTHVTVEKNLKTKLYFALGALMAIITGLAGWRYFSGGNTTELQRTTILAKSSQSESPDEENTIQEANALIERWFMSKEALDKATEGLTDDDAKANFLEKIKNTSLLANTIDEAEKQAILGAQWEILLMMADKALGELIENLKELDKLNTYTTGEKTAYTHKVQQNIEVAFRAIENLQNATNDTKIREALESVQEGLEECAEVFFVLINWEFFKRFDRSLYMAALGWLGKPCLAARLRGITGDILLYSPDSTNPITYNLGKLEAALEKWKTMYQTSWDQYCASQVSNQ